MKHEEIQAQKSRLRSQIRERAAGMSAQEKARSDEALCGAFLALPQLEQSDTVLFYYGVGSEVRTEPLLTALLAMGKRVLLPSCLPQRQMEARLLGKKEDLVPGVFGIPEPSERCLVLAKDEIPLILVPALCCDRQTYRLGKGGGYYDRYLADYSGFTVALCREILLQDALPRHGFDQPVSLVLTEHEACTRGKQMKAGEGPRSIG